METVKVYYKSGLYTKIGDKSVGVMKFGGKYIAQILDTAENKLYSREYAKLENVNKFFNKYGIQVIF